MIDFEKFHDLGYIVFSIDDFFENDNDRIKFTNAANKICAIPPTDDRWHYTMSVVTKHEDPEWPLLVKGSEREAKMKLAKERGLHISQRWHTLPNFHDYTFEINELIAKNIRKFYPEINADYSNLIFSDAITLYKDGDHIEKHRDGSNQGRFCAILIYLNSEDPNVDGGGHLVVSGNIEGDSENEIKIKPVRGNVVLLDFNRHDPFHTVELVKNGFLRYAYLAFLWNFDKVSEEQKQVWEKKLFHYSRKNNF